MQFLSTLCMAAIASALFRMLMPEKGFGRQISLLISALFLLAGINAFKSSDFSADSSQYSYEDSVEYISFSGDINKELQKKICSDMSDKLYSMLNSAGIYPQEIHIIVNISGLYSISITEVELVFSENQHDEADLAAKMLAEELSSGIRTEIIFREGS